MNEIQENDDWLEQVLNHDNDYIDDNGFTDRVMQDLPLLSRRGWLESVILIGATLLSSMIAFLSLPGIEGIYHEAFSFITSQSLLMVIGVGMIIAFVLSGVAWVLGDIED